MKMNKKLKEFKAGCSDIRKIVLARLLCIFCVQAYNCHKKESSLLNISDLTLPPSVFSTFPSEDTDRMQKDWCTRYLLVEANTV
jgi:hypothetical protein